MLRPGKTAVYVVCIGPGSLTWRSLKGGRMTAATGFVFYRGLDGNSERHVDYESI